MSDFDLEAAREVADGLADLWMDPAPHMHDQDAADVIRALADEVARLRELARNVCFATEARRVLMERGATSEQMLQAGANRDAAIRDLRAALTYPGKQR